MYRKEKVKDFPVVKDGLVYCISLLIVSIVFGALSVIFSQLIVLRVLLCSISVILALTGAFILLFFRNPVRISNAAKNALISPADGKVLSITEIEDLDFIGGKAIKVSIFLSLFNVHINRCPVDGTVIYHQYREGQMLPAFKSHASDINERNTIGIQTSDGYKFLVHQITGFVARRIVWWVKEGDLLKRGERFGLIRFGSCTEVVMPLGTKICVLQGDVVRGGITVIAEREMQ